MRTLSLLFGLLSVVAVPGWSQAECYLAGELRHNFFARPAVDGTWKQDLITGGSEFNGDAMAWGAGIGCRITAGADLWVTRGWSVEMGYMNLGSVEVGGRWVSDEHYTQVMAHGEAWLDGHGVKPKSYTFVDHIEGGYLRAYKALYSFHGLEPYASVGMFGAQHTLSKQSRGRSHDVFTGTLIGFTVGGGVKYDLYRGVTLRVGVELLQALSESKHPPSSQLTTVGGGIEVPFTGWW